MRSGSLLILGLFGCAAFCQNYSRQCKEAEERFPEADVVTLEKTYHLDIVPAGDTIEFIATIRKVNYIKRNSRIHATEFIYYSSEFAKISDLEAYTINLASSKKTKFEGFSEGVYYDRNIFYDDNRETYFQYPDIQDNVVTEMEYKMRYSEPRLIPSYYFSFIEPVLHSTLIVTFPTNCEIGWLVKDQGKYKIEMTQKMVKGKNEYTWTLENSAILSRATQTVSASKVLPHVIVWIKTYTTKKGSKQVLGDINDLYSWYNGFVNHAKTKNLGLVKNIADSLTANTSSDIEKAAKIFRWVQNSISYVAVEDGYSGFIPRRADDVIRKKYGDCKDMANLIVELMRNSGLDARHAWIGTRDIPYTYYDVYTPIVDNHMIATVKLGDRFYFLDATGKFMPFGFPTSMIQGKIALIEEDSAKFILEKVDVINADLNVIKDSAQLEITDRTLKGIGTYQLTGYPMINAKIELGYTNIGSEKDYYKRLLLKGNNKFKLLDYKASGIGNENSPISIEYKFEMEDYISTGNSEIFVNMNIGKTDLSSLNKQEVNEEVYSSNDYNYVKEDHFILNIPTGYGLDFIPENYEVSSDFLTYSSQYRLIKDKLVLYRRLVVNYLELNKEQVSKFNSIVSEIQKIERSNVLLTNKK